MNEFELFLEKVFNFYNVSTIKELSVKIDTKESTISNWKQRKSLSALKKRCRELGIYNEIFGNASLQKIESNYGQNAQDVGRDQNFNSKSSKYNIDDELLKLIQVAIATVDNNQDKIDQLKSIIKKWMIEQL